MLPVTVPYMQSVVVICRSVQYYNNIIEIQLRAVSLAGEAECYTSDSLDLSNLHRNL